MITPGTWTLSAGLDDTVAGDEVDPAAVAVLAVVPVNAIPGEVVVPAGEVVAPAPGLVVLVPPFPLEKLPIELIALTAVEVEVVAERASVEGDEAEAVPPPAFCIAQISLVIL